MPTACTGGQGNRISKQCQKAGEVDHVEAPLHEGTHRFRCHMKMEVELSLQRHTLCLAERGFGAFVAQTPNPRDTRRLIQPTIYIGRGDRLVCAQLRRLGLPRLQTLGMCNLYSMTRNRDAIRRLFRVDMDRTGNQPPLPTIFPDQLAPVVRVRPDGVRLMETMRWGFPPPPNLGTRPVTNVGNTASPYWCSWLKPEFRCLVPATRSASTRTARRKSLTGLA